MERYHGRVLGVIVAAEEAIGTSVDDAHRLAAHGEPPEALVQLAWAISRSGQKVPRWIIEAIHELGDEINDPSHLPPDLGSLALDESDDT